MLTPGNALFHDIDTAKKRIAVGRIIEVKSVEGVPMDLFDDDPFLGGGVRAENPSLATVFSLASSVPSSGYFLTRCADAKLDVALSRALSRAELVVFDETARFDDLMAPDGSNRFLWRLNLIDGSVIHTFGESSQPGEPRVDGKEEGPSAIVRKRLEMWIPPLVLEDRSQ